MATWCRVGGSRDPGQALTSLRGMVVSVQGWILGNGSTGCVHPLACSLIKKLVSSVITADKDRVLPWAENPQEDDSFLASF